MMNQLREELLSHLESTEQTRTGVSKETGLTLSGISHFLSGRSGLSPKNAQALDAYLAKVNGREPMPAETFMFKKDIEAARKNEKFKPWRAVKEVVSLRELMDDAFDVAYQVYFYEDGGFDIVSLNGSKALAEKKQSIGYRGFNLRHDDYEPGIAKTLSSHRIVATYYHPNPENKPQVNHIDGNKANNHPDNLEWVTAKENRRHAFDTGLQKPVRGMDNVNAKVTLEQAAAIRIRRNHKKETLSSIAARYGIRYQTVWSIANKKTWNILDEKPVAIHIDELL
ncbi:HNH endonuclease signature motif containing protein [Exiguobacterium aurantiacum]|uniref:HNH endonuclease signature motif containing protein n=1 Tax=Exiguobacterium aurantiacum TaxID=33987 RepID=UPI00384EBE2F